MLVSFSVGNYRSFGAEVTLNMVASNKIADLPHHRVRFGDTGKSLVRAALLYGANAAGKSNLVKAMSFAQQLICWPGGTQGQLPAVDRFRFDPTMSQKPSCFEFRFLVGDRVFIYGFDVSSRRIDGEWLAFLNGDEEITIFERGADGETKITDAQEQAILGDATLHPTLSVLNKLSIRPTQLFLNRVASLPEDAQGPTLHAVIKWLTEDLEILEPEHRACELLDRLHEDELFRDFSSKFLDNVDTGIQALRFEETTRECSEWERDLLDSGADVDEIAYHHYGCWGDQYCCRHPDDDTKLIVRRLLAAHKAPDASYPLPFSEESHGTQQLLHFLPVIAAPKDESKVVVIDELDRSLHPLLCWELIRFFSDSCPEARKQLVVTTHESHLLNQELLRRDEYWFVEKDEHQQSQLVSLSDFKVRNDLKLGKGYLQGRFGAIPVFGGLSGLHCLLDCPGKEGVDATETPSS